MGKLINLSTMREVEVPMVEIGRVVKYTGDMANHSGFGAVVAIRPGQYRSYDVALEDGREILGTMLDGSRWIVTDETCVDLATLRAGVAAKKATDAAAKSAAAQAFAEAKERVLRENPHLVADGSGSYVQAAKNIRIELKRAFPGIKFSVRSSSYSGGNSIDVAWTDGPTVEQVEAISGKYQGGSFDGMTDCYNYSHSAWCEVFGDAKYVFENRSYSDKMLGSVMARVCRSLGGMEKTPTVEDYRNGRLWAFKQSGGCDVQREINVALSRHTCAIAKA